MNKNDLLALLGRREFGSVLGATESVEIEFKRALYRIDDPRQQFELAKDVSALANTQLGGLLVIGFATSRPDGTDVDTVTEFTPVARADFTRETYINRIQALTYPQIAGLNAEFTQLADDETIGVVVITVPPQAEADRYFVVSKRFQGPEDAPGWLVGVCVRSLDATHNLGIAQIHNLMNRGLTLGAQLDGIHALVNEIHAGSLPPADVETEDDPLPRKINDAIERLREGRDR